MIDHINVSADDYLEHRARRGDMAAFERAMRKVPDVDELLANSIQEEHAPNEDETSDSDQTGEKRRS